MTGTLPQEQNRMAWLELAAGATCASRVWLRERLLGAALVALGLAGIAEPALADQNVLAADNGTVRCDASLKDLTRITLKDDQFASVSKIQTGSAAEDFQGFVYKVVCAGAGSEAKQVFVANAEAEHPAAVGERWPAGLSDQEGAARLISAMYVQKPVEGFDITWRPLAPVNVGSLKVQLVGQYSGSSLTGKLLKLANTGNKSVTLSEDQVAPADALAVSLAQSKLEAGQETTAFVIMRAARAGDQP